MTQLNISPAKDEMEGILFGPGYGESVVLHAGDGVWVLVDSYMDRAGEPRALKYLTDPGVDPAPTNNGRSARGGYLPAIPPHADVFPCRIWNDFPCMVRKDEDRFICLSDPIAEVMSDLHI